MNIQKMLQQAQRMQAKLAEKQAELSQKTIEASAGGGKVTVTANGAGDVLSIKIDPSVVDPEDVEMLEDLVLAGVKQAIEDPARKASTRFEDYRSEGNIFEPHRVSIDTGGSGPLTFLLQRVSYNTGINDIAFDPPRAAESVDVAALLREVSANQDVLEQRASRLDERRRNAFIKLDSDRHSAFMVYREFCGCVEDFQMAMI